MTTQIRPRLATNGYAAKRAIIDALKERAQQQGNPLTGRQVAYSWPGGRAEKICVYGGALTFRRPGDDDAADGEDDVLADEVVDLGLHIRAAAMPEGDEPIEAMDILVEQIADEVAEVLGRSPRLAGGSSISRIGGGQGEYSILANNEVVSNLALLITVESYLV